MDMYVVIGVTLVVVIGGLIAARLWWNLASKSAPYEDEVKPGGLNRRSDDDDAEVVPWNPAHLAAGMAAAHITHDSRPSHGGSTGHDHATGTHHGTGHGTTSEPLITEDFAGPPAGGYDSGPSGFDSSGGFDSGGGSFDSGSSSSSFD